MTTLTKAAQQALEPCPFCGAQPEQCDVGIHHVSCPSCGIDGPDGGAGNGKPGAISAWNTRAALQDKAGEVRQFRRVGCADWYDGNPDHEDGRGPYEARTLYAAQPAPVVPDDVARYQAIRNGLAHKEAIHEWAERAKAAPEPVGEPVARVELMQTGGNAGLATRIVEIDDPLRERLRPGDSLFAQPAPVVPDGFALVPVEPTEEQWGGLARDIMLAFDMNAKSPALLINVLTNLGHEIPQWLRDEIKDPESTYVLSKGTRAVIIYRAMLAASQQKGGQ